MKQICKFNLNADFKQTAPNLSTDLQKALQEKVIPSTGVELEHNEIQNSSDVGIRVRDNFEAIEAQRYLTDLGKKAAKVEKGIKADEAAKAAERAKTAAYVNPSAPKTE